MLFTDSMPLRRPCSGPGRLWLAVRHGDREKSVGRVRVGLLQCEGQGQEDDRTPGRGRGHGGNGRDEHGRG